MQFYKRELYIKCRQKIGQNNFMATYLLPLDPIAVGAAGDGTPTSLRLPFKAVKNIKLSHNLIIFRSYPWRFLLRRLMSVLQGDFQCFFMVLTACRALKYISFRRLMGVLYQLSKSLPNIQFTLRWERAQGQSTCFISFHKL